MSAVAGVANFSGKGLSLNLVGNDKQLRATKASTLGGGGSGALSVDSAVFAVTAGAADHLVYVAGNAQSAAVGTAVAIDPQVQVVDASGNPVSGTTVNFSLTGGGGSVGRPAVVSDASGLASSSFVLGGSIGSDNHTMKGEALSLPGVPKTIVFSASGTFDCGPRVDLFVGSKTQEGAADGFGHAARFFQPSHMASDGTYVYLADSYNHTIRRFDPRTAEVITLAGKPGWQGCADGVGVNARFNLPYGLAVEGGFLYIASFECRGIFQMDLATHAVTLVAGGGWGDSDGYGLAAEFRGPVGLVSDGTYLYIAEGGGNRIRKMDLATNEVSFVAGSLTGASAYANGVGAAARFDDPVGVVIVGNALYVTDSNNYAVRKIDLADDSVTTFAGKAPPRGSEAVDGIGTSARFQYLGGLATDGTFLYVADSGSDTIRKVEIATAEVSTVVGFAWETAAGADGPLSLVRLNQPVALLLVGGQLYLTEGRTHRLRKVDFAGQTVATVAGQFPSAALYTDMAPGFGSQARFGRTGQMLVVGSNLYIAESAYDAIQQVDLDTAEMTLFAGGNGTGGTNGGLGVVQFNDPAGLATDGTDFYVSDGAGCTIRKITTATMTTTTLAGSYGNCDYADGVGAAARFQYINSLVFVGGYLYAPDGLNCAIRRIDVSTGAVTTVAGAAPPVSICDLVDGVGNAARFNSLFGIATDGTSLFVSEDYTHAIRRIDLATMAVSLFAGSTVGFADGPGIGAQFFYPKGLSVSGGYLYVADQGNHALRKIELASGTVSTVVGDGSSTLQQEGPLTQATIYAPHSLINYGSSIYFSSGFQGDSLPGIFKLTTPPGAGPGVADHLEVTEGNNQVSTIYQNLPINPKVRVVDISGIPVAGYTVHFHPSDYYGAAAGASDVVSDAQGYASTTLGVSSYAGGFAPVLVAENNLLPGAVKRIVFMATIEASTPDSLVAINGNGQSAGVGTALPISPQVRVVDGGGNAIANHSVNFSVIGGGGSLGSASGMSDALGCAKTPFTLGPVPGLNQMKAEDLGLPGTTSVTFSATGL